MDACAPFGFGLRRIFPPKAFAFFGTSTTNTHNGLHTDARRTFPIAQAPHRARRSPRALIKSRDKAKGNPGSLRGFLFAFYSCCRRGVGLSILNRRRDGCILPRRQSPSFEKLQIVTGVQAVIDTSSVSVVYDYWRARRKEADWRQKNRREVCSVLDKFDSLFQFVGFCCH